MKGKFLFCTLIVAAGMSTGYAAAEEEAVSGQTFSFADVADREFYFSSGVGAWYTVLHIHEDGTFEGHYQDADMGLAEEAYPNGTLYYSDFSGSFTAPVMSDDHTWVFQIDSIEYPLGFGEEIKDGFYYDYTAAYGLDGAEDLYMYLPGAKLAELPEAYRSWTGYYDLESVSETELSFYGLYNEKQECGFSSYSNTVTELSERAAQEISNAEARAAELEEAFKNVQIQTKMNEISGQIYNVWDDTLNVLWGMLKENLDEASMEELTQEELRWIEEKEAEAQKAGAEYEGGSMYEMVVNRKAAEMTKERVYVLAGYLNL